MGRYDEIYSETCRRAIGTFLLDPDPVTDRRRTVPQCLKLLMAGELRYQGDPVPVPPKQPPASTMYEFKRREEKRRKGEILSPLAQKALENPEQVRESIMQRAVSIWDYEQERLEQMQRKGTVDNGLFSRQIKNAPVVMAMLRALKAKQDKKPNTGDERATAPGQQPDQPDELTQLVEAHEDSRTGVTA
jgi:hypothetical protein